MCCRLWLVSKSLPTVMFTSRNPTKIRQNLFSTSSKRLPKSLLSSQLLFEQHNYLTSHLNNVTKGCAFRKELNDAGFSFYMDSKPSGVVIGRNGEGLKDVWRDQLREFQRVSLEVANSIVAAYPSPAMLKLVESLTITFSSSIINHEDYLYLS